MVITAFYASLAALLFVFLSARVIRMRVSERVALGDGGDEMLGRRLRAHGNFAEYAPLALVLMALAESQGASVWILHGLGLLLLAGRSIHAFAVSRSPEPLKLRVLGMGLTFTALIGGALTNLGFVGLSLA